jgi:hypothetical protein
MTELATAEPAATAGNVAKSGKAGIDLLQWPDQRTGLRGLLNDEEFTTLTAQLKASRLVTERRVVGDLMADIALNAWDHAKRGSWRRGIWTVTWKAASSLSAVVTAALGGSILAFNSLPTAARYALAAIAFLAAAIAAIQPGEELAADRRRHNSYASLHRRILHYVMTSLPGASLEHARTQLEIFNNEFDHVLGDAVEPMRPPVASTQPQAASEPPSV